LVVSDWRCEMRLISGRFIKDELDRAYAVEKDYAILPVRLYLIENLWIYVERGMRIGTVTWDGMK